MNQSGMPYDFPRRFADGKESLATSLDAARLQKAWLELARDLFFAHVATAQIDTPLGASLFPVYLDVVCFEPPAGKRRPWEDREKEQLAIRLRAAFEAESLEDGMDHPAEGILAKALRSDQDGLVFDRLKTFCLDDAHPSFAASVLRCLGRQTPPGTSSWRAILVRDGLAMEDVEIRDAAVQAAELWGDSKLLDILESHSEPVRWLRDYIQNVIEDLGK